MLCSFFDGSGSFLSKIFIDPDMDFPFLWENCKKKEYHKNMKTKYFSFFKCKIWKDDITKVARKSLRISIKCIPTFTPPFNIFWMKPYHSTRVPLHVFCKLWSVPLINLKFYARQAFGHLIIRFFLYLYFR